MNEHDGMTVHEFTDTIRSLSERGQGVRTESLSFEELGAANRIRCEASFHMCDDWSPTDWACAAAGELGEACNLIKKLRRGEAIDMNEVGNELADAVIYIDLLAQRLRIDLAIAVRRKFNIVSDRVGSDVRL